MTPAAIGGSSCRQVDARLRQQRPQRLQGRAWLAARRRRASRLRAAVDLGLVAEGAPDDVGVDADDGIASAHGAALHRFQQAAHGPAVAELQHGRDRRLEVGDEPRPHDLRTALPIGRSKRAARRLGIEIARGDVQLRHAFASCLSGRAATLQSSLVSCGCSVCGPRACLSSFSLML